MPKIRFNGNLERALNISICDDEAAQVKYLQACVTKWAAAREIKVNILKFDSAENFLNAMNLQAANSSAAADILFLDIQMKEMDGIRLARLIREADDTVQIIFVTGFADYMPEGYDVSALHYLLKPVREEKLFEVLDKAAQKTDDNGRTIMIQTAGELARVPLNEIFYAEAFAHYVLIKAKRAEYETRAAISEIEKQLGDGFIRCHRSYIVNLSHVRRITKTDLFLPDGTGLPLSRRMYAEVNRAFIEANVKGKIL